MNNGKIFMTAVITLALSACVTTGNDSSHQSPDNLLSKTQEGWQSNSALTSLYDYQLIDVRGEEPKVVKLNADDGGLPDYDIVFIGENHRHPGNHLAQAMIYQRLLASGEKVILSLEQFERDTQSTLDAYLNDEIGEWSLRHFGRAWDNYPSSYRPLVEMAKAQGLPVIAANAPKDTVICTGRNGLGVLDKLPAARKGDVAVSLHTPEEGAYFDKFAKTMSHGGASPNTTKANDKAKANDKTKAKTISQRSLNGYHAQVVRDDTMAESIHRALEANPGHKLVHLNGHFHSASGLGTVERVKLRRQSKIAVIQPVLVNDPKAPSFNEEDISTGDYLLLIHPLPELVKTEENKKLWMKSAFKRSEQDCSFGAGSGGNGVD